MTFSIMNGPELMDRLIEEIAKGGPVDLAVAFWGQGAAKTLAFNQDLKVRLICNLETGGTNPKEIRSLMKSGIEIKVHNMLHAKIGTVGTDFSFLGSSNMSANGLGYEGGELNGWEEANIAFDYPEPSVEKRFSDLWAAALEITEEQLKRAEKAWRSRQKANQDARPAGQINMSFLEVLKQNPKRFEAHNTNIVVYTTLADEDQPKLEDANETAQRRYGSEFEVYWDWVTLPADAVLVDFRKPVRGMVAYEGLYRRHPDFKSFKENNENFQPAYRICDIDGVKLGDDRKALREAVQSYIDDNPADEDDAYCFPIGHLRDYL